MTVTRVIVASSSFVATAAKIPACDHARADRFNGCIQHFPASPKNRSLVRASVGVNTLTGLGLDASAADGTRSASRFAYHESLRLWYSWARKPINGLGLLTAYVGLGFDGDQTGDRLMDLMSTVMLTF